MKPPAEIIPHIEAIAARPWRGETVADQRAELDGFEAALKRQGPLDGDVVRAFAAARKKITVRA
jgi:hypothetical protein